MRCAGYWSKDSVLTPPFLELEDDEDFLEVDDGLETKGPNA